MSHIVSIETEVRDVNAIRAACKRQRLDSPVHGQHKLFSSTVEGWAVKLTDWKYPAVCDTNTGQVRYDNYGGRWGKQVELDRFLQSYACEKTKIAARKQGHSVLEQPLEDGSIKLTVQVSGGTA